MLKDSGIEWIGKIPEDWDIIKGKYIYDITTGKLDANAEDIGGIYPFFTCSMEPKKINSYAFDCEALLVAGNGIVGFTQYYKGKFNAYQRTYVLSNFSKIINPKYLKFYVSDLLEEAVTTESYGSVISFIKLDNLKNFYVVFPSIAEQTKIANFLDDKCSKIDKAIELNKKAIEEEKEYFCNIMENLIEQTRNNSKIIKLKYLGKLQNGISANSSKFGHGSGIFINYGDVYKHFSISDEPKGKIDLTEKERKIYSTKKGDIFFTRTSETIEEVGMSAVALKDYPNSAYSGFVIRFRQTNKNYYMNPNFYKYYFKMNKQRNYFTKEMNIVTRASLSQDLLGNIPVYIPEKEAQNTIANGLDNLLNNIEQAIKLRNTYIEQLEEYKKSLIYEAVTGKIEV